ncbi:PilZ domain-containing protein [Bacteriovorax sp. DB6_IX]|uniref:PilZ domain-containing protein n=1 Tax=Bacteriovorax sp. DB6_IX TaxID=1353530 RepID=UPI00038A4CA3|nr:PilZ domain-containing protein [Bacteriovorax sp. DB6_IX]EQC50563.1 hypothetical protein M901_2313 [Bacteriovorax sp. DB6_IX]
MAHSQRNFLRAPVNDEILYLCDGYVLKGMCSNISEGGVLLSQLGKVPEQKEFSVLIPLIQYPEFSKIGPQKIISVERSSFDIEIIRAKVNVVRSFEGKSEVEKILIKNIGAQFVTLTGADKVLIVDFVNTFTKNLIHLLTLFESQSSKGANISYIRKIAELLGYDGGAKLPLLRQRVLHDYQSLESL